MADISSRDQSIPYEWGSGGTGWPLIQSAAFEVKEEELASGCSETRHKHDHTSQSYYILSGSADVEIDGKTMPLREGDCIFISAGSIHKIANQSSLSLRFLVISVPPVSADRIETE